MDGRSAPPHGIAVLARHRRRSGLPGFRCASLKIQRLTLQDVKLLHTWEQAHRAACGAERLAMRAHVGAGSTRRTLQQSAVELRAYADASFRLLLEVQAFGELADMPLAARRPVRHDS